MNGVDWVRFFTLVGEAVLALSIYAGVGHLLPVFWVLHTLRVTRTSDAVHLRGTDFLVTMMSGFALCGVPFILVALGVAPWLALGASLVTWFGFRVHVQVTRTNTLVLRTFAFAIPWSVRTYARSPRAFVDGWGDFLDPEALYVGFVNDEQGERIELGWSHKDSGERCKEVADDFNGAVGELRKEPPTGGGPYR
jgi:hypothetical protein